MLNMSWEIFYWQVKLSTEQTADSPFVVIFSDQPNINIYLDPLIKNDYKFEASCLYLIKMYLKHLRKQFYINLIKLVK